MWNTSPESGYGQGQTTLYPFLADLIYKNLFNQFYLDFEIVSITLQTIFLHSWYPTASKLYGKSKSY